MPSFKRKHLLQPPTVAISPALLYPSSSKVNAEEDAKVSPTLTPAPCLYCFAVIFFLNFSQSIHYRRAKLWNSIEKSWNDVENYDFSKKKKTWEEELETPFFFMNKECLNVQNMEQYVTQPGMSKKTTNFEKGDRREKKGIVQKNVFFFFLEH